MFQNNVQRLSGVDLTRPSPKPGELLSEFDGRIGFAQHWLYRTSDHIPHGLGNFARIFFVYLAVVGRVADSWRNWFSSPKAGLQNTHDFLSFHKGRIADASRVFSEGRITDSRGFCYILL